MKFIQLQQWLRRLEKPFRQSSGFTMVHGGFTLVIHKFKDTRVLQYYSSYTSTSSTVLDVPLLPGVLKHAQCYIRSLLVHGFGLEYRHYVTRKEKSVLKQNVVRLVRPGRPPLSYRSEIATIDPLIFFFLSDLEGRSGDRKVSTLL